MQYERTLLNNAVGNGSTCSNNIDNNNNSNDNNNKNEDMTGIFLFSEIFLRMKTNVF